jgi:hypothetical protein
MEVVVNRDALLAEVAAAQGITSSRTTIPILSNLLIEAQDCHSQEAGRCHRSGAEAVRLHQAAFCRRHQHQAAGE